MFAMHVLFLCVKEDDTPVDWDLSGGSAFLNYLYSPLPSIKFQLLCVRMLGQLIVHGVCNILCCRFLTQLNIRNVEVFLYLIQILGPVMILVFRHIDTFRHIDLSLIHI